MTISLRFLILIMSFTIPLAANAAQSDFKTYQVDWKPLKKHPSLYNKLKKLQRVPQEARDRNHLIKTLDLLKESVVKEPRWVDGYWMVGNLAFQVGSTFTTEAELPLARKFFLDGRDASEKCLTVDEGQPLCKLFLGSAIGKIGAIDGIFASIKNAKRVLELWIDVSKEKIDFVFMPNVSMQGSVNYALGMFHRLVPDLFIVDWLFGVRGNLDRSIEYHRRSIEFDGANTCNLLMLSVALLCKADGDAKSQLTSEAISLIGEVEKTYQKTKLLPECVKDTKRLRRDHSLACGYDTNKQQENSDKSFSALSN